MRVAGNAVFETGRERADVCALVDGVVIEAHRCDCVDSKGGAQSDVL